MSSEHERVALLRAIFDAAGTVIGDDCAVLARPGGSSLVWSVDASVEHVHFDPAWMSLADIGFRATMAAFSDLAAMGAAPLGGLSALTLPPSLSDAALEELARGQKAACDALGTALLGGNLARGAALTITTTVLGEAARPLTRAGATPGAGVYLAGKLGLAAAGLFEARRGDHAGEAWDAARAAFRRPLALLVEGRAAAAAGALAAIDVSDGLTADLAHLARESSVACAIDDAAVEVIAAGLPVDPAFDRRAAVLSGGEDYALIVVAHDLGVPFVRIGEVMPATPTCAAGTVQLRRGEVLTPLGSAGFDHFG